MFDILKTLESKEELLTVSEVAKLFSVSKRTIDRMVADRTIPSFLIGGMRRFDPGHLHRWMVKRSPKINEGRTPTA